MIIKKPVHIFGYASGLAAADESCREGPLVIQKSPYFSGLKEAGVSYQWEETLQPDTRDIDKLSLVSMLCQHLAHNIAQQVKLKQFFLTLGGDHSSAIGTWSGAAEALREEGDIGLIWIDAHMDSHTPLSSHSGNIHGMPVACLLGHGAASLTQIISNVPKIKPEHLCLIGVRSYELEELAFLQQLNVRVIFMDEVNERGLEAVFQEALAIANTGTVGYGLSIDIDSIDPNDAPGTGVAEPNGISGSALCDVLKHITHDPKCIGAEIVEFDPRRDQQQRTEKLISELISTIAIGRPNEA